MTDLRMAALRYAELGYPVFPCVNGLNPAPLTRRGFRDASTDPGQIEAWWQRDPAACIGLAAEGLLVVDVDGPDNPWLTEERWHEFSNVPAARTPRGGWHFVFRRPEGVGWRCSVGRLAPNVDVRTDGGYIVMAPSTRPDGDYHWEPGRELKVPADQLSAPPGWLAEALDSLTSTNVRAASTPVMHQSFDVSPGSIPTGQRNSTLASIAGRMRQAGLSESEIHASLEQVNRKRCNPPLGSTEIAKIATSIARYQPGLAQPFFPRPTLRAVNGTPIDAESNVIWFSEIEPVEIDWLWPGRIPAGRITLLVGLPGKGKSLVTVDMAARVSNGTTWPDGATCPRGSVILITAEDNPNDTIRPRLDAAGADVKRVGLLSMINRIGADGRQVRTPFSLADVYELEQELAQLSNCKLIVIDPIGSFLGSRTDAHRDNEVRAVLAPVAALAETYGAAVVVVAHRRKGHGLLADDLALGSRAFTGLARAVWHVTADPQSRDRRLLLPGKNNLAKVSEGLAFSIDGEPPSLIWEAEPVHMNADECLAAEAKAASKPGPRADELQRAIEWLQKELEYSSRPAVELYDEALEKESISKATLRRAKKQLGVESFRLESRGPWQWRFPGVQADPQVSEPEHLEHLIDNFKTKRESHRDDSPQLPPDSKKWPKSPHTDGVTALEESVATR